MSRVARPRIISISGSEAKRLGARSRRAWLRKTILRGTAGCLVIGLGTLYAIGGFDSIQHRCAQAFYHDTAAMGLRVNDLALEGRNFTNRADIVTALGVSQGDPILAFDPAEARATLENLPRVASAEVERRLPDTILVRIVERAPVAIWQRNGKTRLIDREGVVLGDAQSADFATMPLLVGEGANLAAKRLLETLSAQPNLAKRISACIRVGDRRWDLKMDNNVTVKLPETGADAAIQRLAALEDKNGLLEHDVVTVDLRIANKLVVETSQPRDPKHKPAPQQGI